MPRRGGGRRSGGGGFFGRRRSTSSSRASRTQAAPRQAAAPQQTGGLFGAGGGLFSTIATGMALGAGSEVGHQAVRGLMGGGSSHGGSDHSGGHVDNSQAPAQSYAQPAPCQTENTNFVEVSLLILFFNFSAYFVDR